MQCKVDRRVRIKKGKKKQTEEKNEDGCHGPKNNWALTLCMQRLNRDLYKKGQEERAGQLVIGCWQWAMGSDI